MTCSRNGLLLALLLLAASPAVAGELPAWLPRYDLEVRIDVAGQVVTARETVTWTNRHRRPADTLIFNAHSHYAPPKAQIGYLAKTLELIRVSPAEGLDTAGAALDVSQVSLLEAGGRLTTLPHRYEGDTDTDLVITLPRPVGPGESVTVVLDVTLKLPQKMGRWGQWHSVTTLSNWLPVLAVYDEEGWHPTPFIPWHQPFFNEAGVYQARVTLPADQKLACTGSVTGERMLPEGWREVSITAEGVREFSLLCSAGYQEFCETTPAERGLPPVRVRVLAFPEDEFHARETLRVATEAIAAYGRWFGAYPYPEFTVVEAFFGWNGNECSTLVMIDHRVLAMPHLACSYVEYLVAHETCHQWWYNMVGTNGYCETWMDEALAVHFTHKLMTIEHGKNNELLKFPRGLEWLPNIRRDDYRAYGLLGTVARGENSPIVQPIDQFAHLANLFSMCYDKGSRVVGLIEERLGETAFLDFIRVVHGRYRYRILRVADFQRELEEYTGQSWQAFFDHWLRGSGLCDWAVEKVHLDPGDGGCRATVLLRHSGDYCEPTTLGIALAKDDAYPIRIPIDPQAQRMELPQQGAVVEAVGCDRVRVEVVLPCKPKQIAVDPDRLIVDPCPANNYWKKPIKVKGTPLYTALDETDLTTSYDHCNLLFGPYVNRQAYDDPWYVRGTLVGFRAGTYKTQDYRGGVYAAYRTDYRDVVVGADGTFSHCPCPQMELGFNVEQRLVGFQDGRDTAFRAEAHARWIFQYGSSLYLPPMSYLEGFGAYQDNFLPLDRNPVAGARRYDNLATAGIHFHKNYLTPYWDPVAGYQVDLTYAGGSVDIDGSRAAHQFLGQVSAVVSFPNLTSGTCGKLEDVLAYLADSRIAVRAYGAGGLPDEVEYFPLGGGTLFRGFDQAERQGSLVWVGSVEWRLPLVREVEWDVCDHSLGGRNLYGVVFYDAGDALTRGHSVGPVVHAVGAGLRLDVALFGFVERSVVRLDFAKTLNAGTPLQVWFGVQHPF